MFLTTTWAFYIFCCDFKEKKVIQRKEINILYILYIYILYIYYIALWQSTYNFYKTFQ